MTVKRYIDQEGVLVHSDGEDQGVCKFGKRTLATKLDGLGLDTSYKTVTTYECKIPTENKHGVDSGD